MAINLIKNEPINLTEKDDELRKLTFTFGWNCPDLKDDTTAINIVVFLTDQVRRTLSEEYLISSDRYRKSPCGAVTYHGCNSDSISVVQSIQIDLTALAPAVKRIVFAVAVNSFQDQIQNLGCIENAYLSIMNTETNSQISFAQLNQIHPTDTAFIVGEIYRVFNGWEFNILAQGFANGFDGLAGAMGLVLN